MPLDIGVKPHYSWVMVTAAGQAMAARLTAMKWTQGRLRKEFQNRGDNLPTGMVCRWISGEREPSIARAILLDEILGLPLHLWTKPARPSHKAA